MRELFGLGERAQENVGRDRGGENILVLLIRQDNPLAPDLQDAHDLAQTKPGSQDLSVGQGRLVFEMGDLPGLADRPGGERFLIRFLAEIPGLVWDGIAVRVADRVAQGGIEFVHLSGGHFVFVDVRFAVDLLKR